MLSFVEINAKNISWLLILSITITAFTCQMHLRRYLDFKSATSYWRNILWHFWVHVELSNVLKETSPLKWNNNINRSSRTQSCTSYNKSANSQNFDFISTSFFKSDRAVTLPKIKHAEFTYKHCHRCALVFQLDKCKIKLHSEVLPWIYIWYYRTY